MLSQCCRGNYKHSAINTCFLNYYYYVIRMNGICGVPLWGSSPQGQTPCKASTSRWLWARQPSHQGKTWQPGTPSLLTQPSELITPTAPLLSRVYSQIRKRGFEEKLGREWCSCLNNTGKCMRGLLDFNSWGTQSDTGAKTGILTTKHDYCMGWGKVQFWGEKNKQIMFDLTKSRHLQERCRERDDGQERQAICFGA